VGSPPHLYKGNNMTVNLKDVGSGFKRTAINENFDTIESTLNNDVLLAAGGNQMEGNLDANSNRIINLLDASTAQEPATLSQLTAASTLTTSSTDLITHVDSGSTVTLSSYLNNEELTLAEAIASPSLFVGAVVTITDRAYGVFDVVLASGVTPNTFNIVQCTGVPTLSLVLRYEGVADVKQFGAVGDGAADDTAAIQEAINFVKTGGTLLLPAGLYVVTNSITPQYDNETPLERYNAYLNVTANSGPIEDITIVGYGARLITTAATFGSTFPNAMLCFVDTERVTVKGLQFEADLNNKVSDWFDESQYMNTPEPTPKGASAMKFFRFKDAKVQDSVIEHCNVGINMADDTVNSPSLTDVMETYRGEITGCRVYNTHQAISISIGAMEQLNIHHNTLEYTFVKLVQETDQGRAILFNNNTCRDVAGILISTNDSQITNNTFNNLLGGIRLQPGGGGNPNVVWNYDLENMIISDNTCYSDHATTTLTGTAQPSQFLSLVSNSTLTAGQTVTVSNSTITGNKVALWPSSASTTAGSVLDFGGDAPRILKNMTFDNNEFVLNNGNGAIVALSAPVNKALLSFDGHSSLSNNSFERTTASSNIEISLISGSFNQDSVWTIEGNYIDSSSTNIQFSLESIGKVNGGNNVFTLGNPITAGTSVYSVCNVPKLSLKSDRVRKFGASANRGYYIRLDGTTTTVYDTEMDLAKWFVNEVDMDIGSYIFTSSVTFPTSAAGLYDFKNCIIADRSDAQNTLYPTLSGFVTENVVSPYKGSGTPPALLSVIPPGYIVPNLETGTGKPMMWVWDDTWLVLGSKP